MGVLNDNTRLGISAAGTYEIDRSLRFNSADNAGLSRTFGTVSTADNKTWTISFWTKRSKLGVHGPLFGYGTAASGPSFGGFYFNATDDSIHLFDQGNGLYKISQMRFRDTSAWYHIVVAVDAANTVSKAWVNGVELTYTGQNTQPSNTGGHAFTSSAAHYIGTDSAGYDYDGYITEMHICSGLYLDHEDFGKTDPDTGQWVPIKYTGGHGTHGSYLNFSDNSNTTSGTLGADSSANSNDWTPTNFSVAAGTGNDSLADTPTNNYATLNLLYPNGTSQSNTFTNGNLQFADAGSYGVAPATMSIKNDKYYWEVTAGAGIQIHGIIRGTNTASGSFVGYDPNDFVHGYSWQGNGHIYGESGTGTYEGTTLATGQTTYGNTDVIGFASDIPNGTLKFYKGDPSDSDNLVYTITGINSHDWFPAVSTYGANICNINFGQRPFSHTPPTGHKTLCTADIAEPTIKKGEQYFNTILYEGEITDTSTQTEDGVGFQPNLTWIKRRDASNSPQLVDSVRGVGKWLEASGNNAEQTNNTHGVLTAFDSDGFTLTGGSTNANQCCEDGNTYVAWNWKESASAGFDIIAYNGDEDDTISHSLGVSPELMIIKSRESANNWMVWHNSVIDADNKVLNLDLPDPIATSGSNTFIKSSSGGSYTVGSSSFKLGSSALVQDGSSNDYIAYLFDSVEGYSKVGTYKGNGANGWGPFIYTGFKPAFIFGKGVDTDNWFIFDNKRNPHNPVNTALYPSTTGGDNTVTADAYDFLSNGFRFTGNGNFMNESGVTYIFLAIAETPFKYATAR